MGDLMKCQKCGVEYEEFLIEESHDIPKYMFEDPKEADKHGRHYLCRSCHQDYETQVLRLALMNIIKFSDEKTKSKCRFAAKIVREYYFKDTDKKSEEKVNDNITVKGK